MKNIAKMCSLLSFFGFYFVGAQEVIKKDTLNGTELTISMDQKVNSVLEGLEDKCSTNTVLNTTKSTNSIGVVSSPKVNTPKVEVPKKNLSNAEICRDNPRILGYKIQIAVVKSNDEANEVKSYFRRRFPNIKAETDASLRPNYKILVGSYLNKQSASADLAKIRPYFKSALAIQYRVFCVEAK